MWWHVEFWTDRMDPKKEIKHAEKQHGRETLVRSQFAACPEWPGVLFFNFYFSHLAAQVVNWLSAKFFCVLCLCRDAADEVLERFKAFPESAPEAEKAAEGGAGK